MHNAGSQPALPLLLCAEPCVQSIKLSQFMFAVILLLLLQHLYRVFPHLQGRPCRNAAAAHPTAEHFPSASLALLNLAPVLLIFCLHRGKILHNLTGEKLCLSFQQYVHKLIHV